MQLKSVFEKSGPSSNAEGAIGNIGDNISDVTKVT